MFASAHHPICCKTNRTAAVFHSQFEHQARRFVDQWMPLICAKASKMSSVDFEDYKQIGLIALWECSSTFDCSTHHNFEAYAHRAVQNRMISELRRRNSASATCVQFCCPTDLCHAVTEDGSCLDGTLDLDTWLKKLEVRDHQILRLIYWEGCTLGEVSDELSLSPARVSQIHSDLLARGRHFLNT
ncbi:sigma-70 family RNA polymerase sigma factor [Thalassoglobus sp.]|uniref:sigma-70 family RNA polymerase sigma factor n=1 Tax=Thalassoglobus sp. TaxID=2795869 RepID=UPI003AA876A0